MAPTKSNQLLEEYELFLSSTMKRTDYYLSALSGLLKRYPINKEIDVLKELDDIIKKQENNTNLRRYTRLRQFLIDYGHRIVVNKEMPQRIGNLDIVDRYLSVNKEIKFAPKILNTFVERNEISSKSVTIFLDEKISRTVNRNSYAKIIERFLIFIKSDNFPRKYKIQAPSRIERALVQARAIMGEYEQVIQNTDVITDADYKTMILGLRDIKDKAILELVAEGVSIIDILKMNLIDAPNFPLTQEYINTYRVTRPKMPLFYDINKNDIIKIVSRSCDAIGRPNTDVRSFRKLRELSEKLQEHTTDTMKIKVYKKKKN